jgi:hypothetical protein
MAKRTYTSQNGRLSVEFTGMPLDSERQGAHYVVRGTAEEVKVDRGSYWVRIEEIAAANTWVVVGRDLTVYQDAYPTRTYDLQSEGMVSFVVVPDGAIVSDWGYRRRTVSRYQMCDGTLVYLSPAALAMAREAWDARQSAEDDAQAGE